MTIRNPYATVDWAGPQVAALSHAHGTDKTHFLEWVNGLGGTRQYMGISNYYPSDPNTSYPLTHLSSVTLGDIPAGTLGCPNAEHHSMANCGGHFGAIGSMLATGTSTTGYGGTWQNWINAMITNLLYSDGGAVCINHPVLSYCGDTIAMAIIDYLAASSRIPVMELFSSMGDWYYGGRGWATTSFHNILNTGRRIHAAAGLDHWGTEFGGVGAIHTDYQGNPVTVPPLRGYNRLLVPSNYDSLSTPDQEHECLKAYAEGRTYVALATSSPKLLGMTTDGSVVTATFDQACPVTFYSGHVGNLSAQVNVMGTVNTASLPVTSDTIYVRAVSIKSQYEQAVTQAIMFKDVGEVGGSSGDADLFLRRRNDMQCCGIGGW